MIYTDKEKHHIEILLTLDYLLNYTDEKHPASQQDICRYATKFGLKYDSKAKSGNDIRRQRIGECLRFLMDISLEFPDDVPFIIETTDSGKYYVEEKNYLSEEQILKILAAIKNDKYTQDEDTEFLIDRLLDLLSNKHNRSDYKEKLNLFIKNIRKYNLKTNRNYRLINKAYKHGKMIKIKYEILNQETGIFDIYYVWYRVYKLQEYNGKLYATLIPISTTNLVFYNLIVFEKIESLTIAEGKDKDVLMDDLEDNRDFEKYFAKINPYSQTEYKSLENYLKNLVIPRSTRLTKVVFKFNLALEKFIKSSFEDYFLIDFNYKKGNEFTFEEEKLNIKKLKNNEEARFGFFERKIDLTAFKAWLLTDPHNEGKIVIADMIEIVAPIDVKEYLGFYYSNKMLKYKSFLSKARKDFLIEELNK